MGGSALKTSGIDKENPSLPAANGLVRVTINNTVGFREKRPHPFLNVMSRSGTMAESYCISLHGGKPVVW